MGSLVLGAAGAALGSLVGQPALGYMVGSALGAALFPAPGQDGPRLSDLKAQNSQYGSPIPIVFNSYRLTGQIIWAQEMIEHASSEGGSGGGGATTYSYTCSFAVSFCEGETMIKRIWADGKLIYDNSQSDPNLGYKATSLVFYTGSEEQMPDPTIEAVLGVGEVPAYRGQCYLVFTDLELAKYGNRIPNLSVEVGPGIISLCPPIPTTTGFEIVAAFTSDQTAGSFVYVEHLNEFWIIGTPYSENPVAFTRVNGTTFAQVGTVALGAAPTGGFLGTTVYSPVSNAVWSLSERTICRWNTSTFALDFAYTFTTIPTGSFGNSYADMTVDRSTGALWIALDVYVYLIDTSNGHIAQTFLIPDSFDANGLNIGKDGICYVTSYGRGTSTIYSCTPGGGVSLVYTDPDGLIIREFMAYDSIRNALWFAAGDDSYNEAYHRLLLSTGEVDIVIPNRFGTQGMEFDAGRNMLWVEEFDSDHYIGFCGINGEVIHDASDPLVAGVLTERQTMSFRPPGNNIYFTTDADDGSPVLARYKWTQPPLGGAELNLGQIISAVSARTMLEPGEYDTASLIDAVPGFCITANMSARAAIDPLMNTYAVDAVESGSRVKFVKRGGAPAVTIPAEILILENKQ